MKVLVLNGSPKREQSCTLRMARAFVAGITAADSAAEVELLHVADLRFTPCRGCLSCWGRTPGECVLPRDDATAVREKILAADVVIWAFPLYFFGMPGIVKLLLDRLLPLMNTYRGQKPVPGEPFHGFRYDLSGKKLVVLTSCGYAQTDVVYDSLRLQLDAICGANRYLWLPCPQGKTMQAPELRAHTERYLARYTRAGEEFARTGALSAETSALLGKPPFTDATFRVLLNAFWEQEAPPAAEGQSDVPR